MDTIHQASMKTTSPQGESIVERIATNQLNAELGFNISVPFMAQKLLKLFYFTIELTKD